MSADLSFARLADRWFLVTRCPCSLSGLLAQSAQALSGEVISEQRVSSTAGAVEPRGVDDCSTTRIRAEVCRIASTNEWRLTGRRRASRPPKASRRDSRLPVGSSRKPTRWRMSILGG